MQGLDTTQFRWKLQVVLLSHHAHSQQYAIALACKVNSILLAIVRWLSHENKTLDSALTVLKVEYRLCLSPKVLTVFRGNLLPQCDGSIGKYNCTAKLLLNSRVNSKLWSKKCCYCAPKLSSRQWSSWYNYQGLWVWQMHTISISFLWLMNFSRYCFPLHHLAISFLSLTCTVTGLGTFSSLRLWVEWGVLTWQPMDLGTLLKKSWFGLLVSYRHGYTS